LSGYCHPRLVDLHHIGAAAARLGIDGVGSPSPWLNVAVMVVAWRLMVKGPGTVADPAVRVGAQQLDVAHLDLSPPVRPVMRGT
jgi:hypothetical protein